MTKPTVNCSKAHHVIQCFLEDALLAYLTRFALARLSSIQNRDDFEYKFHNGFFDGIEFPKARKHRR